MFSGSQCLCIIVSKDVMDLFLDLLFCCYSEPTQSNCTADELYLPDYFFLSFNAIFYHFPPLCNQVASLILFQNCQEINIDTFCYNIEKSMTYLT